MCMGYARGAREISAGSRRPDQVASTMDSPRTPTTPARRSDDGWGGTESGGPLLSARSGSSNGRTSSPGRKKNNTAEPLMREAVASQRDVLGNQHRETLKSISNLALLLQDQGKLAEAEALFREALVSRISALGGKHRDTLAAMANLARLLQEQGDLAESEKLAREALATRRKVLGPAHRQSLESVDQLGRLLQDAGKLAEAETLLREAEQGRRDGLGERHRETLESVDHLARLLQVCVCARVHVCVCACAARAQPRLHASDAAQLLSCSPAHLPPRDAAGHGQADGGGGADARRGGRAARGAGRQAQGYVENKAALSSARAASNSPSRWQTQAQGSPRLRPFSANRTEMAHLARRALFSTQAQGRLRLHREPRPAAAGPGQAHRGRTPQHRMAAQQPTALDPQRPRAEPRAHLDRQI